MRMLSASADDIPRADAPGFCLNESENFASSTSTSRMFSATTSCRPRASSHTLPESLIP